MRESISQADTLAREGAALKRGFRLVPKPASPTNRVSPEGEQKRKRLQQLKCFVTKLAGRDGRRGFAGWREEWG